MTQTESRLARPLFLTSRKSHSSSLEVEDCHYCLIKQKFSGPDQKCLEHTITDNRSESSSSSHSQQALMDRVLELLGEAEDCLEEYWNNLHEYSRGDSGRVRQQLREVREAVGRIGERLGKFPWEESVVQVRREGAEERKMATRSQKFITSNFSQLFDDPSPSEHVKEWVLHFHKILLAKELQEEPLPLDQEIDMRIFKESMERKFLAFARNYDRYERRLGQSLERLLFYMEHFGSELEGETLSRDLLFLEENEESLRPPAPQEYHRCVLVQALTIQHLLAEKELQLQSSRYSRSN